jgi:hypothetical protein
VNKKHSSSLDALALSNTKVSITKKKATKPTFFILPNHSQGVNINPLRSTLINSFKGHQNIISSITKSINHNFQSYTRKDKHQPATRHSSRIRMNNQTLHSDETENIPSIANTAAKSIQQSHNVYPLNDLNRCYLEDFMDLCKSKSIKVLIPIGGLDFHAIDASVRKHNKYSLRDYIDVMKPQTIYIGTKDVGQLYTIIDCIITGTPYRENAISGSISSNDLMSLGLSSHMYGTWVETVKQNDSKNKINDEHSFSNDYDSMSVTKFLLTWNQIRIGKEKGVQVWTKLPHLRDTTINFKNMRKNEQQLLSLLHFLSLEVYGDKVQTLLLVVW